MADLNRRDSTPSFGMPRPDTYILRLAVISGLLLGCWGVLLNAARHFDPTSDTVGAAKPNESSPAGDKPASKAPSDDKDSGGAEFKNAGVCARCHVVSVLEWSVSGHVEASTNCQKCHGPSRRHVANERNEVKPDRLPRGDAIGKQLCATCHETGCPETLEVQSCQTCHHVHALINPARPPADKDDRLGQLLARWKQFQQWMAEGERHVKRKDWDRGQAAFRAALDLIPGNRLARARLEMCRWRLQPGLPGFKIVGDLFDSETGLPHQVKVEDLAITMLLVPPGEFDMGSDIRSDARPVHTVGVDAFYFAQHEVTQAEWKAVMGTNPSAHQRDKFPNAARMPVERVSWEDCRKFLRGLNQRVAGGGFRLPTEAEWEYACRASNQAELQRPRAENQLTEFAWYRENSLRGPKPDKPFFQLQDFGPRPVGTLRPNERGFFDMQGNVAEWCSSLYRPYLYDPTDGRESPTERGLRVVRGGSYADAADALEPSARHAERPHRRFRWNGLRLARSIQRVPVEVPPNPK